MLTKQRLVLVLVIFLLVPLPSIGGRAQDGGNAQILSNIDALLKEADTPFYAEFHSEDEWRSNLDTALKNYQAALDLVNQNKASITQEPDLTTLRTDEYRALAGKGRTEARQLSYLSTAYLGWAEGQNDAKAPQLDKQVVEPSRADLQAAVTLGEALTQPAFELQWVYVTYGAVLHPLLPEYFMIFYTPGGIPEDDLYTAYELFGKAVVIFRAQLDNYEELEYALEDQSFIASDLSKVARYAPGGRAAGRTQVEWMREYINRKRDMVANELTRSRLGNQYYCIAAQAFSQAMQDGTIQDPEGVSVIAWLQEQIQYDATCGPQNPYLVTTQARLAWLTLDRALAATAIQSASLNIDYYKSQGERGEAFESLLLAHNIGKAYLVLGNPIQALAMFQSVKSLLAAAPKDKLFLSISINSDLLGSFPVTQSNYENEWLLGRALVQVGRYREGIAQLQSLTTLVPDYLTNTVYPGSQLDLGAGLIGLNRYNDAIAPLENARHFYRGQLDATTNDANVTNTARLGLIDATMRLSLPLAVLGRTEEAITSLQEALDEANKTDNVLLKVNTTLRVGDIYLQLQKDDDALRNYQAAADLAATANLPHEQIQALLGVGQVLVKQGQIEDARKALTTAAAAAKTADEPEGEVNALTSLGDLALVGDKPNAKTAQKFYDQALAVATTSNSPRLAIQPLTATGDIQTPTTPAIARLTYYRALTNALLVDDREAQARLYARFGRLASSDPTSADIAYQDAVSILEQTARGFKSEALTSQFAANYAPIYAEYLNTLVSQQRFEQAFVVSEQARARAFLDQLAAGPLDYREGASADLLQKSDDLRLELDKLREIQVQTLADTTISDDARAQTLTTVKQQIQDREREYAEVFTRLQAASPELATLDSVQTLTVAQVQALLDPDTTLISYYTLDGVSYAFVITANSLDCIPLPVERDQLAQWVQLFRDDETQGRGLQELGGAILTPLVNKIKTSRVIVVPHNVLNYVPFAAIPLADGTLFGEKFVLSYLPSASTLAYLAKPPAQPGSLLALGNPAVPDLAPLKFADKEVQDVAGLLGGRAFTGEEATLSRLLNQASDAGVLYIAAHGTFNERAPLFSALHLTASGKDDGLLEAYEIYSLDLTQKTELVVLSACETDVGGLTAGDEFSGLNRAFLYAGSPAVISTLWSVDDQATSLLMQKFFELRRQGQANVQALQQAQQYIRTYQANGQTPYASPYFWAGFVLTGRG